MRRCPLHCSSAAFDHIPCSLSDPVDSDTTAPAPAEAAARRVTTFRGDLHHLALVAQESRHGCARPSRRFPRVVFFSDELE